ncbi:hypothetical protein LINPERHAP2_LOCUS3344, partial [Linum perenne]
KYIELLTPISSHLVNPIVTLVNHIYRQVGHPPKQFNSTPHSINFIQVNHTTPVQLVHAITPPNSITQFHASIPLTNSTSPFHVPVLLSTSTYNFPYQFY